MTSMMPLSCSQKKMSGFENGKHFPFFSGLVLIWNSEYCVHLRDVGDFTNTDENPENRPISFICSKDGESPLPHASIHKTFFDQMICSSTILCLLDYVFFAYDVNFIFLFVIFELESSLSNLFVCSIASILFPITNHQNKKQIKYICNHCLGFHTLR